MYAVLRDTLNTVPLNAYDGPELVSYEIHFHGSSITRMTGDITLHGISNVIIAPHAITVIGSQRVFDTFEVEMPGSYDLALISATINIAGVCDQFATYADVMRGQSQQRADYTINLIGECHVLKAMEVNFTGASKCGLGYLVDLIGKSAINQTIYTRCYRQGYRVADNALARLELYAGYDAMPDFDDVAQPVASGSSITWTPVYPGPGLTTVLHLVIRERNMYGLLSFNQHPKLIEIDENGMEVLGPITVPEFVKLLDGSTVGSIQAWARYPYQGDRNPADTWELYAKAGADPVVGVDSPVKIEVMGSIGGGLVPWRGTATGLTPGLTYHVMIVVRRGDDNVYAQSDVLEIEIASVFEVEANALTIFAGGEYEINQ